MLAKYFYVLQEFLVCNTQVLNDFGQSMRPIDLLQNFKLAGIKVFHDLKKTLVTNTIYFDFTASDILGLRKACAQHSPELFT